MELSEAIPIRIGIVGLKMILVKKYAFIVECF